MTTTEIRIDLVVINEIELDIEVVLESECDLIVDFTPFEVDLYMKE